MMPISCIECRRRKVKCNKLTPCNQCIARSRVCEYPPKFRSIKVEQFFVDGAEDSQVSPSNSDGHSASFSKNVSPVSGSDSSAGIVKTEFSGTIGEKRKADDDLITQDGRESLIMTLRKENESLKLKLKELKLKNKRMRVKDEEEEDYYNDNDNDNTNDNDNDPALVSSSKDELDRSNSSRIYYGPNSTRYMISTLTSADVNEFDDFIKVKRQMKQRRQLPILYNPGPGKTMSAKQRSQENLKLIYKLVSKFFHLRLYYTNYLDLKPLTDFLNNYQSSKTWKNDDDILLLIIMVMIVSLRSLPPTDPVLVEYDLSYEKSRPLLYKQYRNLKNGIPIETTTSLRAYVLECEDLFYNDQIERCWNSLFKTVSSAYSLGLHVYDENIVKPLKIEQHENALDVIQRNPKASLWFVINFISATLCSVLGRPNPVTFNFQPLLRNYEIRLNYKIGLAELVKRSTNVLIESYKIQISFDTILEIDEAFVNEALTYEKILIDTRVTRNLDRRDESKPSFISLPVIDKKKVKKTSNSFKSLSQINLSQLLNDCPLDIRFTILRPCPNQNHEEKYCLLQTDCDTLSDLILLYGNRAKFHQHFMSTYRKSLESCLDSVLKVLEHSLELVQIHNAVFERSRFQEIYPFFYTFLYQTLVVMYTLMHLGYGKLSPYWHAIGLVRQKLIDLFETVGLKNWRDNVIRIIQYINDMCDNFFKMYWANGKTEYLASPTTEQSPLVHSVQLPPQTKATTNHSSRQSGLFHLSMTPANDSPKQVSASNEVMSPVTSLPSFSGIQLHNIPEHISNKFTQEAAPTPSTSQNLETIFPANQGSSTNLPPSAYYANNSTSLSQVSLSNYNLDYYDPKVQMFPLPQSRSNEIHGDPRPPNNGADPTTVTVDPLLGFDLSDPFFIQNPYNFNYTNAAAPDVSPTGSEEPEGAATNNRPDAYRMNSNDSNQFTSYVIRNSIGRSESVDKTDAD